MSSVSSSSEREGGGAKSIVMLIPPSPHSTQPKNDLPSTFLTDIFLGKTWEETNWKMHFLTIDTVDHEVK